MNCNSCVRNFEKHLISKAGTKKVCDLRLMQINTNYSVENVELNNFLMTKIPKI